MEILKVENLVKSYGKEKNKFNAVDGVSLSVEKGEFVAIVGKSGSGKSTLLHMIGGVDKPTAGNIYIDGELINNFNDEQMAAFRRRKVGIIYQFYNLIPILNISENITLPCSLDDRKVDEAELKELVTTLGLGERLNHLPNELSGGEQQRVAIGRALINKPALILADEPTGNLDTKASAEIVNLLKLSNQKYHQTIIMVTHDLNIAASADRIIHIEDGHIVKDERLS